MPAGRPTDYNQEIVDAICAAIASGASVNKICESSEMPAQSTVFAWLAKYPEFTEKYAQAIEKRSVVHAEEIIDIADDGTNDFYFKEGKEGQDGWWEYRGEHVQRSKLRVDTRKWLLSKLQPKKYGDKQTHELTGKDGAAIVPVINIGAKN